MIKFSRKFGMTIYEIAEQKRDFISEFKTTDKIKQKKLLGFKHYVYQNSKKYYETILQQCFAKINSILKG